MRISDQIPPEHFKPALVSPGPQINEKLLTVKQAAELLACTPITVYRLIYRGHLRSSRVGRAVRIQPAAIREMLSSGPVDAGQDKPAKPKGKGKRPKGKRFDDFLMP